MIFHENRLVAYLIFSKSQNLSSAAVVIGALRVKHSRHKIGFLSNTGPDLLKITKIVSEYDQEIPQSQTADKPMAPQGRATQPSRDTRKTN